MNYGPSPVVPQQAMAELVTNPLYDSATIANGALQAQYFIGANANAPTFSNVSLNGQLANPKFARLGGFRIAIGQNVLGATGVGQLQDWTNILYTSYFQFVIGNLKEYVTAPSFCFPAGLGVMVSADRTTAEATAGTLLNGQPIFGSSYRVRHIISLPPLQQFGARLVFNAAVTIVTTQRTWLICDAELGREVL